MSALDALGWVGFSALLAFYWMIGTGRPAKAYLAATFGAACYLVIGVALQCGYTAKLPSLVVMESTFIVLNLRALVALRRERRA